MRSIVDGTSKTIIVVESKEQNYSSWYDGNASWVVAVPLNQASLTSNVSGAYTPLQPIRQNIVVVGFPPTYFWQMPPGGQTALNYGPKTDTQVMFHAGFPVSPLVSSGYNNWLWGPSSDHSGGTVMHAWADAHVSGIAEDVDASVYMHLVTRAGKEPDSDPTAGS